MGWTQPLCSRLRRLRARALMWSRCALIRWTGTRSTSWRDSTSSSRRAAALQYPSCRHEAHAASLVCMHGPAGTPPISNSGHPSLVCRTTGVQPMCWPECLAPRPFSCAATPCTWRGRSVESEWAACGRGEGVVGQGCSCHAQQAGGYMRMGR